MSQTEGPHSPQTQLRAGPQNASWKIPGPASPCQVARRAGKAFLMPKQVLPATHPGYVTSKTMASVSVLRTKRQGSWLMAQEAPYSTQTQTHTTYIQHTDTTHRPTPTHTVHLTYMSLTYNHTLHRHNTYHTHCPAPQHLLHPALWARVGRSRLQ